MILLLIEKSIEEAVSELSINERTLLKSKLYIWDLLTEIYCTIVIPITFNCSTYLLMDYSSKGPKNNKKLQSLIEVKITVFIFNFACQSINKFFIKLSNQ